MPFNSIQFLIFFPIVVTLYFSIPHKYRWAMLLAASYYFYMCWNAAYIILIIISTLIAYISGLWINKAKDHKQKKYALLFSLIINLGILFIFKYFNFFVNNLQKLFTHININMPLPYLNVLLPVGISFYTFQALSYSIDVYKGEKKTERHIGIFSLYVAFFPQLVSGPIERSTHLLPQFFEKHKIDYKRIKNGLLLMLWGFFKKLVIADRTAILVNQVYNHAHEYTGIPLITATIFFAFQVYCDFSGYSDIAIGAAETMGFDLIKNFNRPYFSKSITELWRRWHISLSTWIQDYLYTPLAIKFRHYGISGTIIALLISFSLIGLWHGAKWTFVIFGAFHGIIISIETLTRKIRKSISKAIPTWIFNPISVLTTFIIWCLSIIFFRANSLNDAVYIITHLLKSIELKTSGYNMGLGPTETLTAIFFISFLMGVEIFQAKGSIRTWIEKQPIWIRWTLYYGLIFCILIFGKIESSMEFVYFQF